MRPAALLVAALRAGGVPPPCGGRRAPVAAGPAARRSRGALARRTRRRCARRAAPRLEAARARARVRVGGRSRDHAAVDRAADRGRRRARRAASPSPSATRPSCARTWRPRAPTPTGSRRATIPTAPATGMMVKAYRADWDGTLQPYALYVPRDYKPGRPGGWPLIVALHGAYSDHRHNLRRVFGLDNRPRENDAEASRNELPLPDVPALVVSPFGRGELMGYDGLGGDDVMRVHRGRAARLRRRSRPDLADRAVDGGRRHVADRPPPPGAVRGAGARVRGRRLPPDGPARRMRALYDLDALDRRVAGRARRQRRAHAGVHLSRRQGHRPCPSPTRARWSSGSAQLGWLGKNVRYTEYPGVAHSAWIPAYKDAALLRTLAAIKRDPARPRAPRGRRRPACAAVPGPVRQERAPAGAAHLRLRHARRARRGRGRPRARERDGRLGADGRRAVRGQGRRRRDRRRSRAVLAGAGRGGAAQRARGRRSPCPTRAPLGDRAFRALGAATPRRPAAARWCWARSRRAAFDRLKRFARPNRDGWAPEPNRPFVARGLTGRRRKIRG